MIIAILVLTIFNTGLIVVVGASLLSGLKNHITDTARCVNDNTDKDVETAVTAIYNMDSLKQKVEMNGRVEL